MDLRNDQQTIQKLAKNKQKPITTESAERQARELRAVKYVECSALTQVSYKNLNVFNCSYLYIFCGYFTNSLINQSYRKV